MINIAYQHLLDTAKVLEEIDTAPIAKTIEILRKAKIDGNQVFLFGNGGSHSNASHFANDLLKVCGIKAICISDMIPTILAYMNDTEYKYMFEHPIIDLSRHGDVLIGFSCSGNSDNVYFPLMGRGEEYDTIVLTGDDGGKCAEFTNIVIKVHHPNIRIQESCHSAICHAIVEALQSE